MTASAIPRPAPARNWGSAVIAAAGVFALALDAAGVAILWVPFQWGLLPDELWLQPLTLLVVPAAVLVGFVPLSFGARGFASIAGTGSRARLLVFSAAIVAWIAQLAIVLVPTLEPRPDQQAIVTSLTGLLALAVFAVLLAIVAGFVIARARVVRGFARWSLLVAVALTLATLALYSADLAVEWQDVPRAIGILALGLSYSRAGRISPTDPDQRVTVGSKSLAE
jgi:hypothetical protein